MQNLMVFFAVVALLLVSALGMLIFILCKSRLPVRINVTPWI